MSDNNNNSNPNQGKRKVLSLKTGAAALSVNIPKLNQNIPAQNTKTTRVSQVIVVTRKSGIKQINNEEKTETNSPSSENERTYTTKVECDIAAKSSNSYEAKEYANSCENVVTMLDEEKNDINPTDSAEKDLASHNIEQFDSKIEANSSKEEILSPSEENIEESIQNAQKTANHLEKIPFEENNTQKQNRKPAAAAPVFKIIDSSATTNTKRSVASLNHLARTNQEKEEEKPIIVNKEPSIENNKGSKNVSNTTKNKIIEKSNKIYEESPAKSRISQKKILDSAPPVKKLSASQVSVIDAMDVNEFENSIYAGIRPRSNFNRFKKNKAANKRQDTVQEKVIREVEIPPTISIQELAVRMSVRATELIKQLLKMGLPVSINQSIDADTAELIVIESGHKAKRVNNEEESVMMLIADNDDTPDSMQKRAPVVTIMGHVDHGKTSLLDALRSTDIASGEFGGITQHIGAYNVTLKDGESITFLDTPGHEAFTAMRMRGAKVTDIVVLVVAANDGIKAQTIEAISHAKAAQVPIIVAVNKMDHPEADFERVKNSLLNHELVPEDMGGDVMVVGVSALSKQGLDKLEESILLCAEFLELKAAPNRVARGHVIEAKMDKQKGICTTFLIEKGTLKIGDNVVAGKAFGRIKSMIDDKGRHIKTASPSTPVEVFGLNTVPTAGDSFVVTADDKIAKTVAEFRIRQEQQMALAKHTSSLERLIKQNNGLMKELVIIIKADVKGSLEAIVHSLQKLNNDEVTIRIIMQNVGGISDSDVSLASTSSSLIVGFNVRASSSTKAEAERIGVDIRYYSIIYDLINDVKSIMGGMLSPIIKENVTGYVQVKKMFNITNVGKVAGCYVTEGIITRSSNIRLLRDNIIIFTGKLKSLKRGKDDIKEVKYGFECGIVLETDIAEGDVIEAYEILEEKRNFDSVTNNNTIKHK